MKDIALVGLMFLTFGGIVMIVNEWRKTEIFWPIIWFILAFVVIGIFTLALR